MGEQLAAPERDQETRRRDIVRPDGAVGAGRDDTSSDSGRESANPLRLRQGGVTMSDKDIDRRTLVNGLIVAGAAAAIPREAHGQTQVPNSSGTEPPKLKAPANACDCHMHIYDAKYPIAPTAALKPPDATVADYKLLQGRMG